MAFIIIFANGTERSPFHRSITISVSMVNTDAQLSAVSGNFFYITAYTSIKQMHFLKLEITVHITRYNSAAVPAYPHICSGSHILLPVSKYFLLRDAL